MAVVMIFRALQLSDIYRSQEVEYISGAVKVDNKNSITVTL